MGLLADSVGKVLDALQHGVRLYAVRDTTASAPTDAKWNPLQVGATGGLRTEGGPFYTASTVQAAHDSNEIAANKGFIVISAGDLVFRLRDDTGDRTIAVTAGERFDGLDIKLFKTASTATILVLR